MGYHKTFYSVLDENWCSITKSQSLEKFIHPQLQPHEIFILLRSYSDSDEWLGQAVSGIEGWEILFAPAVRVQIGKRIKDSYMLYSTRTYQPYKDKNAEQVKHNFVLSYGEKIKNFNEINRSVNLILFNSTLTRQISPLVIQRVHSTSVK